jgi:hypothetical protein
MNGAPLYVFSHIPKTAGAFFSKSIRFALPEDQAIRLGYNYSAEYLNLITQQREFSTNKEHFLTYLNSLSTDQKMKLKYIGGHDAYYGIHQIFREQARYLTFIRNPITRTISLYNFEIQICYDILKMNDLDCFKIALKKRVTDNFLIDGEIPNFETWLHTIYKKKHIFYSSMSDFLQSLNYIDHKRDEKSFTEALNKFYFVGITERFESDAAFLFYQLKISKLRGGKNKSIAHVKLSNLSSSLINQIKDLNADDFLLYECAMKKNDHFKNYNHDYHFKSIVNKTITKFTSLSNIF